MYSITTAARHRAQLFRETGTDYGSYALARSFEGLCANSHEVSVRRFSASMRRAVIHFDAFGDARRFDDDDRGFAVSAPYAFYHLCYAYGDYTAPRDAA